MSNNAIASPQNSYMLTAKQELTSNAERTEGRKAARRRERPRRHASVFVPQLSFEQPRQEGLRFQCVQVTSMPSSVACLRTLLSLSCLSGGLGTLAEFLLLVRFGRQAYQRAHDPRRIFKLL